MASAGAIIIVTQDFDPHADAMVRVLDGMGRRPIRLHTSDFPMHSGLSMVLGETDTLQGRVRLRDHTLDLELIQSVWWRRPARYQWPEGLLTEDEEAFARLELDAALHAIWDMIDC